MERRSFQIRGLDDRIFEGYASIFGNVDSHGTIIEKGSFLATIAEKHDPENNLFGFKVFDSHSWAVGVVTAIKEDERGLLVEGRISATARGNDLLQLINDHVKDQMSIGFNITAFRVPTDEEESRGAHSVITGIDLWEVSPLLWASNPETSIELKGFEEQIKTLELRVLELQESKESDLEINQLRNLLSQIRES